MGLFSKNNPVNQSNPVNQVSNNNSGVNLTLSAPANHPINSISNLAGTNMSMGTSYVSNQIYGVSQGSAFSSISLNNLGPDYIAKEYLRILIDKAFESRSQQTKEEILKIFETKIFNEIHELLYRTFSKESIEFLQEMEDQNLINYLRITEK